MKTTQEIRENLLCLALIFRVRYCFFLLYFLSSFLSQNNLKASSVFDEEHPAETDPGNVSPQKDSIASAAIYISSGAYIYDEGKIYNAEVVSKKEDFGTISSKKKTRKSIHKISAKGKIKSDYTAPARASEFIIPLPESTSCMRSDHGNHAVFSLAQNHFSVKSISSVYTISFNKFISNLLSQKSNYIDPYLSDFRLSGCYFIRPPSYRYFGYS